MDRKILLEGSAVALVTPINKNGEVNSCDILYTDNFRKFYQDYMKYTMQVAKTCQDRDLSENSMVIGTSAIVETELDGVVGMNSGIFNNPFLFWGKYRKKLFLYVLPVPFQFHHTQMDGPVSTGFLNRLQEVFNGLEY